MNPKKVYGYVLALRKTVNANYFLFTKTFFFFNKKQNFKSIAYGKSKVKLSTSPIEDFFYLNYQRFTAVPLNLAVVIQFGTNLPHVLQIRYDYARTVVFSKHPSTQLVALTANQR